MRRFGSVWILLGALALSFILYGNTIGGEFVYDDESFANRPELRDPSHLLKIWAEPLFPQNISTGIWRPLTTSLFSLNFIVFGDSPMSFHIINIILNGIAIFLVYLFTERLTKNKLIAFCAALFFAFLPINTGTVAFIKARDEILSTIFILLAWIEFLKISDAETNPSVRPLILSVMFFALALVTKEQALLAPGFFFGFELLYVKRKSIRQLARTAIPYCIVIILYIFFRVLILGNAAFIHDDSHYLSNPLQAANIPTTISTAFKIAYVYISKTFIPIGLSSTYTYNHLPLASNFFTSCESILGFLIIGGFFLLAFSKKTRSTTFAQGSLIFLLCYIPISRFIFKGAGEIVEENWMYLPSIGLSILAGSLIYQLYQYKKMLAAFGISIILLIYGIVIINRNKTWHDPETFYHAMVLSAPESPRGYLNMAIIHFNRNEYAEAYTEIEKAYQIYPDDPRTLDLLGKLEMLKGNYAVAEKLFIHSIDLRPSLPESHKLYARVLAKEGRYAESLKLVQYYLTLAPSDTELHYLMAVNLYKLGKIEEAKQYFDWRSDITEQEKIELLKRF